MVLCRLIVSRYSCRLSCCLIHRCFNAGSGFAKISSSVPILQVLVSSLLAERLLGSTPTRSTDSWLFSSLQSIIFVPQSLQYVSPLWCCCCNSALDFGALCTRYSSVFRISLPLGIWKGSPKKLRRLGTGPISVFGKAGDSNSLDIEDRLCEWPASAIFLIKLAIVISMLSLTRYASGWKMA